MRTSALALLLLAILGLPVQHAQRVFATEFKLIPTDPTTPLALIQQNVFDLCQQLAPGVVSIDNITVTAA